MDMNARLPVTVMSVRTHGLTIAAHRPATVVTAPTVVIIVDLLRVAAMTTRIHGMTETDLPLETAGAVPTLQALQELRGPGGTISEQHHPALSAATAATLKVIQKEHAVFSTSNSRDAWVNISSNLSM